MHRFVNAISLTAPHRVPAIQTFVTCSIAHSDAAAHVAGRGVTVHGEGSVDIKGFIDVLEAKGYEGWYVIEQDVVLDAEPESDEGPIVAAARSFAFLEDLANG